MKNKINFLLIAALFSMAITGCEPEVNTPVGEYSNGIFVINEGAFLSSNAEISFVKSNNTVSNNLYATSNSGLLLGDILQSMHIYDGNAYLVVNNSNKIEIVDLANLQNEGTISGLEMPRYMVSYNGKGYISEYVSFSGNGKVLVVNLATNAIIDTVNVGKLPENLLVVGDKILVANSGDTTLHLISTSNLSTTNIGDVDYPKYITKTNDGNIWVLYTGKPGWAGPNTDGGLLVLNSTATAVVKTITIGSTSYQNPSQLATDGNNLYYEYQGNVYKIDKSATVIPSTPFITSPTVSLYGMNYYAANNTIMLADAKNFSTAGVVKRYNASTGALLDTLNVGIAPNGFVFN